MWKRYLTINKHYQQVRGAGIAPHCGLAVQAAGDQHLDVLFNDAVARAE